MFPATAKKPSYPIGGDLREYLARSGRECTLPVAYGDLKDYLECAPLYDARGEDTHWHTVIYSREKMEAIRHGLKVIYAILKAGGDLGVVKHVYVDRIDYCTFGNSNPFRIRVVNALNENQDYYYIKKADASRVYGLELEHLLSPFRILYLTHLETLVEEHIAGIPGDMFISDWLHDPRIKGVRLAKELIKFNERCFLRLLGDMRSYNFVVDLTPDFEEVQIKIRAMDFDQQSYAGRKNFYLPQFFKENNPLVEFTLKHLSTDTAFQYQREEHYLMYTRAEQVKPRLRNLLKVMQADTLSTPEKVRQLRSELAEHYQDRGFQRCTSMGSIVRHSLRLLRDRMRAGPYNSRPGLGQFYD